MKDSATELQIQKLLQGNRLCMLNDLFKYLVTLVCLFFLNIDVQALGKVKVPLLIPTLLSENENLKLCPLPLGLIFHHHYFSTEVWWPVTSKGKLILKGKLNELTILQMKNK